MLIEDEEAADAIVAAIGRLSYEQLQVVQVYALLCIADPEHHPSVTTPVPCLLVRKSMITAWPQEPRACRAARYGQGWVK